VLVQPHVQDWCRVPGGGLVEFSAHGLDAAHGRKKDSNRCFAALRLSVDATPPGHLHRVTIIVSTRFLSQVPKQSLFWMTLATHCFPVTNWETSSLMCESASHGRCRFLARARTPPGSCGTVTRHHGEVGRDSSVLRSSRSFAAHSEVFGVHSTAASPHSMSAARSRQRRCCLRTSPGEGRGGAGALDGTPPASRLPSRPPARLVQGRFRARWPRGTRLCTVSLTGEPQCVLLIFVCHPLRQTEATCSPCH
jgi:hypothetical protein